MRFQAIRARRRTVLAVAAMALTVIVIAGVLIVHRAQKPPEAATRASTSSLLVVTWGPSLCTLERSNPGCRSGHVGTLGPTLILHGLWPQPSSEQYCGLSKDQRDNGLAGLNLPKDIQTNLESIMSDVAFLAPHEWKAHGSCSGVTPVEYFGIAATLAEQASQALDPAVRGAAGGRVSVDALRQRMDAAFGPGAGQRLSLNCRQADPQGVVAYEVRISLPAVVDLRSEQQPLSLRAVIPKGPPVAAGCRSGAVPR